MPCSSNTTATTTTASTPPELWRAGSRGKERVDGSTDDDGSKEASANLPNNPQDPSAQVRTGGLKGELVDDLRIDGPSSPRRRLPDASVADGIFAHLSWLDRLLGPLVLLAMVLGVVIGACSAVVWAGMLRSHVHLGRR